MRKAQLYVMARVGPDGSTFTTTGRDAWALGELVAAGSEGCTPITHPGPRWSAYVYTLRRERGLVIDTIRENHTGQFPGTHARYVLRSPVEILFRSDAQERRAA